MNWPDNKLESVERYLYEGSATRVGKYDCHKDSPFFAVTESVADNMFVLATHGLWVRRNTKRYHYFPSGSVLFHPAGSTIERRSGSTFRDVAFWFSIDPDVFDEVLFSYNLASDIPRLGLSTTPELQFRFATTLIQLSRGQQDRLSVEDEVLSLFGDVCGETSANQASTESFVVRSASKAKARRLVDNAKAFIDENLADDIDLGDVAREVGLSAFYLCRLFKSICGVPIHEYRIRQRLAYVLRRLSNGGADDIAGLALDAGFSSHSHLTRTFKRYFDIPPSMYRQLAEGRPAVA